MKRYVLALLILWLFPTLLLFAIYGRAEHTESQTLVSNDSSVATVGEREVDGAMSVKLVSTWGASNDVQLSRFESGGYITSLRQLGTGDVRVGDPLLSIDEEVVLAQVGGVPFYRELKKGAQGADVVQLDALLVELGLIADSSLDSSGLFSSRTKEAVKALEQQTLRTPDGVFDPSTFLYLQEGSEQLDGFEVSIGSYVQPGEIVAVTERKLLAIEIASLDGSKLPDLFNDQPVTILVDDQTWELPSLTGIKTSRGGLETVVARTEDESERTTDTVGTIRLTDSVRHGAVSASSVGSEPDGACIEMADGTKVDIDVSTALTSNEPGMVLVSAELVGEQYRSEAPDQC